MPDAPLEGCWRSLIARLVHQLGGHGVPNIKGAIETCEEDIKGAIKNHPDYRMIDAKINLLWINPFVLPEILFCPEDMTRQKYNQYFAPVIMLDDGADKDKIRSIHNIFHAYYQKDPDERKKEMITLSDLEDAKGKPGELLIIDSNWRERFSVANGQMKLFEPYVELVTNNGRWSYAIYRTGVDEHELGAVYIGYKPRNGNSLDVETKKALKRLCFDIQVAFVLAGVISRNRQVLDMLQDFGVLMRVFDTNVIRHRDILVNLGMDFAESRRKEIQVYLDKLKLPAEKWKTLFQSHVGACTNGCSDSKQELGHATDSNCDGCIELRKEYIASLAADLPRIVITGYQIKDELSSHWAQAIYCGWGERSAVDGFNEAKREISSEGNQLGEFKGVLETLALLMAYEPVVRSNLAKMNSNGGDLNLTIEKINIRKNDDGTYSVEIKWQLGSLTIQESEEKALSISNSKLKPESLSSVLAFAEIVFDQVYFYVFTGTNGGSQVSAYYPNKATVQSFLGQENGFQDGNKSQNKSVYMLWVLP